MASIDWSIKRGDTKPYLSAQLLDSNGVPVNLTGATVYFNLGGARLGTAVITDAANGMVEYRWQSADTQTAGVYRAEFEVNYSGGAVETFPADGYLYIHVMEDVA